MRTKCDICKRFYSGRPNHFRGQEICGICLLDAESSKCENMQYVETDLIYRRVESVFDVCASAPRRVR
jgi:hypothetical protein